MIFVLSALHPIEWESAIRNVFTILKPGGTVLLRDYGRHDLTQVRFKQGRLLEENFYIRGDKTRVYFFDQDDLAKIFTGSPLSPATVHITEIAEEQDDETSEQDASSVLLKEELPTAKVPSTPEARPKNYGPAEPEEPPLNSPFSIEQMGIDRRLLVNRKRQLKMYRVWMQAKFKKREDVDTDILLTNA